MNRFVAIDDISQEFIEKLRPVITVWNRLEGRPVTNNFDRALKAEVRDPLWMLCKQWQMGEFLGDDAGSPVLSKIHMGTTRLIKYQAADHTPQVFNGSIPLEAQVEQRPVPFAIGTKIISLDIRLLMGRQWLKMIKGLGDFKKQFIDKYAIALPDPVDPLDATVTAHKEVWQQVAAVSGRHMDGAALYFYLKGAADRHAYDGITGAAGKEGDFDNKANAFTAWFEKLYQQPSTQSNNAWKPPYMEYEFSCAAPDAGKEKVYTADDYYHGHLDWYNLDIDPNRDQLEVPGFVPAAETEQPVTSSFFPVPVSFSGMPSTRWWSFEDSRTNFGDINPSTTDIGKLLFLEFALVYANDWFLLPFTLDAGSIAKIRGMTVSNVFGERFWIEGAGAGLDDEWNKWTMFSVNTKGNKGEKTDNSLLVLPTTPKILEGESLEEIHFIRDEMANMVWAIEHVIPTVTGIGKPGGEAAFELKTRLQRIIDDAIDDGSMIPDDVKFKASIRYEVMNTVPENWIPFIPVHFEANNRSVRLQRAAMPRILQNNPVKFEKVRPRTTLLREGLEQDACTPYYVYEEEVPRAGVSVYQSFQRTRWYDGKVVTWLGIRKQTGRGEGSSKLAFDQAREVKEDQVKK
ncbi:MAG TPA: hypothetical protein VNR87_02230 [Flavisolibacter sp.]|nr:hypothetical protein [Flavisolibacter sp.]